MFSTLKQKLLLGLFVLLILSIPVGAYLASQKQTIKSSASEPRPKFQLPITSAKPATNSAEQELLDTSESALPSSSPTAEPTSDSSAVTVATSVGPTLALKTQIEGRTTTNQATKLFIGIIDGDLTSNPKFLLNFTVDLPASGSYNNLSLAGLTVGSKYTALLKGSAQIATSSAFVMSPNVSSLNSGQPIPMLSGDLNEDNVINVSDYAIAQKAFGSNSTSSNWNENADINKDGIVNTIDLSIIAKNLNQAGASGAWTSPIPAIATSSASLNPPPNQGGEGKAGYWIWVPGS